MGKHLERVIRIERCFGIVLAFKSEHEHFQDRLA